MNEHKTVYPQIIRKVAVLGAGVMGAQIAAVFVNAKIPVLLFDLPFEGANKSQIAQNAIIGLLKFKPAPLLTAKLAEQITAANYEEHLPLLMQCDLVIEAISENLELKEQLFKRVSPYLKTDAIFATNSSGLSINRLASYLPIDLQHRFLGIHFFNPPRYMHLVEIIPNEKTNASLLDFIETFLVSALGKGVVRAKDTPNFIANRIGVFALLATLKHQATFGLDYATVDALTGTLIGRPKSATFRTLDVVGLDTMAHVVATLQNECVDDPWFDYFKLPQDYQTLLAKGALGQKAKRGFYQKKGNDILTYHPDSQEYQLVKPAVSAEIKTLFQQGFKPELLRELANSTDSQAQFLWHVFRDVFQYCAYHLPHIAHSPVDVDKAMRFGFGWEMGPFELWRAAGVQDLVAKMQQENSFRLTPAELAVFENSRNESSDTLPVYQLQNTIFQETLYDKNEVSLKMTAEKIAVLQFHSKNHVITQNVILGIQECVPIAEANARGLVIWQESTENFCYGANLKLFDELLTAGKHSEVESIVHQFQIAMQALKYSAIPVVAGLRGRALGGGCEILLHCDHIVAACESYVGLVEIAVGLLPAGGGLLHGAKLAAKKSEGRAPFSEMMSYFLQIAQGRVSSSAMEAIEFGYLPENTTIIANTHEVLFHAIHQAIALADSHYRADFPMKMVVGGQALEAAILMQLVNWRMGEFISDNDLETAKSIAMVLAGGQLDAGVVVDEEWFYRLERETFAKLATRDYTKQCIHARLHAK